MIAECNDDRAPVAVVETIRAEGMEVGWGFDVMLRSTSFEDVTPPDSRAEGACILLTTVGLNIRGFIGSTSVEMVTVLGSGLVGTACASLNL